MRPTLFAGAGMDLIGVVDGQAGGNPVVSGFRTATDRMSAQGDAAGPVVTTGGGSTVLTLSAHTQVTLPGAASLPGAAFPQFHRVRCAAHPRGRADQLDGTG